MGSQQQYRAPSVRHLAARVEQVAPLDPARWGTRERVPGAAGMLVQASKERGRQLWMVVGMFDRAVGREEMPVRSSRSVEQLFTWAALRGFWELAAAGELRRYEKTVGRPMSVASLRVVRDCLGILAKLVVPGKRIWLPELDQAAPKPTAQADQLAVAYRELVEVAGRVPLERDGVALYPYERKRLLAMVGGVLDAAPRSGEMEPMRLSDLGPEEEWLQVVRNPQKSSGLRYTDLAAALRIPESTVVKALSGNEAYRKQVSEETRQRVLAEAASWGEEPVVERHALRQGTRIAFRQWLQARGELVGSLAGSTDALWVTVRASKAGPPGLPISAQGIQQSIKRGLEAVNHLMAGTHGWEPMPVHLEQLRRAVVVEPLEE